jgi:hypothetical protein
MPTPRDADEATEDTDNSPGGEILRPMMNLAEERERDMETIDKLDAERERAED